MKTITLIPGSAEWLKSRSASKAAAVMGASKYQSRNDLLKQMAIGITPDVDAGTQARFDNGHRTEALARDIAEDILCDGLSPICGATDDDYLTANFDGLTFDGRIGWEHKDWNEELAAAVRAQELPASHYWQLEQQILVGDLEYVLFMVSDGTRDKYVTMEYRAVPGRAAKLMAGWQLFDADLAAYVHQEVIPAAVATPTMALPALSIQVDGSIALRDNLTIFGDALTAYVERINKKPETDQDFADLEAAVKTLKAAEEALSAAESGALAQTASIDTMRRTVELYRTLARDNRLLITKLVTSEKENRRAEILRKGQEALAAHIEALNTRLGKNYMPVIQPEFQARMKGLKTIDSLNNAVDTELARCKIEANAIADRIDENLKSLRELAADYTSLFPDTAQIVQKANDDLVALIKMRIAEHKAAEDAKLEAERAKIRAEEEAKAKAAVEAHAKAAADAAAKIETDRTVTPQAAQAVQAPNVGQPQEPARVTANRPPADTGRQMNLSEICARLDFTVTALLLDRLGFAAKIDRNSKLYRESDFPLICQALINHIAAVANEKKAA